MRDWRVHQKLAAVLTIPLLGFLVLAGVQISATFAAASHLDTFAQQVAVGRQITALVHELQRERDRTAGLLASPTTDATRPRDTGGLAPEQTAVDRAAGQLRSALRPLLADDALAPAYRDAQERLAELPAIRAGAREGWLRRQAAFDMYSRAIASLHALLPAPAEVAGDPDLGRVVRGLANLAHAKELTAQIRGHLFIVCSAAAFEPGDFELIADVRAGQQTAIGWFREDASPGQLARFDDTVTGQAVRNASRLRQTVIDNARAAELGVDSQQWWLASTTELELMRTVEQSLLEAATSDVAGASRRQWLTTVLGTLATVLLLLVALAASVLIGRSMARTLRSLREQALQVAEHSLPQVIEQLRVSRAKTPPLVVEPTVVQSRDEVGEVANAFTAVHRSAVRLAVEQAMMRHSLNEIFIKLARRSQTLVERQLQLLDTMESTEADPDQLANLFLLDHLATRLRRNDENLLVLAGTDSARRWNKPIELGTIALAAAAEIEHYSRVRQEIASGIYIVGYAVTDLVHLVAELVENATIFSPPETNVEVLGHTTADGGAELVINDTGIGMSPAAVAVANRQVAEQMNLDISAAERMGLVVVGHLARRHGIGIRLSSSGSGVSGVSVHVSIPAALVSPAPVDQTPAMEPARFVRAESESGRAAGSVADNVADNVADRVAPRRAVPTRAEDVLGPSRSSATKSIWWSRDGDGNPAPSAMSFAAAREPAITATTEAGLPKRSRTPKRSTSTSSVLVNATFEPDPDHTGDMLKRLYDGLRQADTDTDET